MAFLTTEEKARRESLRRMKRNPLWSNVFNGLTDNLVGWFPLEENFDEEIHAENSVPPSANFLGPVIGSAFMNVASGAGKVGRCAALSYANNDGGLASADAPMFRIGNTPKTFALWFNVPVLNTAHSNFLLHKGSDYAVNIDPTRKLLVNINGNIVVHPTILENGVWYLLILTHDPTSSAVTVWLNKVVATGVAAAFQAPSEFKLGADIGAFIDEFSIWERILTANEMSVLYNGGMGLTYSDFETTPCRETLCCKE